MLIQGGKSQARGNNAGGSTSELSLLGRALSGGGGVAVGKAEVAGF